MNSFVDTNQYTFTDIEVLEGNAPDLRDTNKKIISEGRILVTGGTGSLGKALLKRARDEEWNAEFTIFSRGEKAQAELRSEYPEHRYVLGDVAKYRDVMRVMPGQDYVFHFAAYKQVPSAQNNVAATLETNVAGSLNIVDAAQHCGVLQVVASSTDKSCSPSNCYGASKYLMETIFQNANKNSRLTTYHLARYGNVVCSNASVIPLFRKQTKDGGPLTITHKDMTRFWITLDQAIDLILLALSLEEDAGALVVPKAPAMSVFNLAKLIGGELPIREIGIRPGEKIHEAMVSEAESWYTEDCGEYFLIHPPDSGIKVHETPWSYTSDIAPALSAHEMLQMIQDYEDNYA